MNDEKPKNKKENGRFVGTVLLWIGKFGKIGLAGSRSLLLFGFYCRFLIYTKS